MAEKFAIRITYPNGFSTRMTSGNHYPPPVAPFYGREAAEEFAEHCASLRINERLTFTVEPYPENAYDHGAVDGITS